MSGFVPPAVDSAPTVSIVTAAYNAASTLAETIESVLAQSYHDWELVVVDDGSTDDTRAIAERYAEVDARVRVLSQPNAGTASARNAGVAASRGGWLCILDADDLLSPAFLEKTLAFAAEHPGFDVYSAGAELLLRDGSRAPLLPGREWRAVRSASPEEQMWESLVPGTSLMRRSVFDRAGGYREVYSEDYDFWLRALILGARQIYNPEPLWVYRRQEGSKTTALVREAESILTILENAREMPELTASQRGECDRAIEFAHARIDRRHLEEALLRGEFGGARRAYLACRRAFPDRGKYAIGFLLMMLSPRWYAKVKADRMV